MAYCDACGRETTSAIGCTRSTVEIRGDTRWRLRFGDELPPPAGQTECPGCRAGRGEFHHAHCRREQCPRCQQLLLSCGCTKAPERAAPTGAAYQFMMLAASAARPSVAP